jgi:hypothetical protein
MGNRDNIQADKKTVREGTTNKKRNKKLNTYNIATWNVRRIDIVREEMKRLDIGIPGISEMKWTGKGHFRGEKDKVMYSGHETHKKTVWE